MESRPSLHTFKEGSWVNSPKECSATLPSIQNHNSKKRVKSISNGKIKMSTTERLQPVLKPNQNQNLTFRETIDSSSISVCESSTIENEETQKVELLREGYFKSKMRADEYMLLVAEEKANLSARGWVAGEDLYSLKSRCNEKMEQFHRANRLYYGLSTLLYASIGAMKANELDTYVRRKALLLPETIFDIKQWEQFLILAEDCRSKEWRDAHNATTTDIRKGMKTDLIIPLTGCLESAKNLRDECSSMKIEFKESSFEFNKYLLGTTKKLESIIQALNRKLEDTNAALESALTAAKEEKNKTRILLNRKDEEKNIQINTLQSEYEEKIKIIKKQHETELFEKEQRRKSLSLENKDLAAVQEKNYAQHLALETKIQIIEMAYAVSQQKIQKMEDDEERDSPKNTDITQKNTENSQKNSPKDTSENTENSPKSFNSSTPPCQQCTSLRNRIHQLESEAEVDRAKQSKRDFKTAELSIVTSSEKDLDRERSEKTETAAKSENSEKDEMTERAIEEVKEVVGEVAGKAKEKVVEKTVEMVVEMGKKGIEGREGIEEVEESSNKFIESEGEGDQVRESATIEGEKEVQKVENDIENKVEKVVEVVVNNNEKGMNNTDDEAEEDYQDEFDADEEEEIAPVVPVLANSSSIKDPTVTDNIPAGITADQAGTTRAAVAAVLCPPVTAVIGVEEGANLDELTPITPLHTPPHSPPHSPLHTGILTSEKLRNLLMPRASFVRTSEAGSAKVGSVEVTGNNEEGGSVKVTDSRIEAGEVKGEETGEGAAPSANNNKSSNNELNNNNNNLSVASIIASEVSLSASQSVSQSVSLSTSGSTNDGSSKVDYDLTLRAQKELELIGAKKNEMRRNSIITDDTEVFSFDSESSEFDGTGDNTRENRDKNGGNRGVKGQNTGENGNSMGDSRGENRDENKGDNSGESRDNRGDVKYIKGENNGDNNGENKVNDQEEVVRGTIENDQKEEIEKKVKKEKRKTNVSMVSIMSQSTEETEQKDDDYSREEYKDEKGHNKNADRVKEGKDEKDFLNESSISTMTIITNITAITNTTAITSTSISEDKSECKSEEEEQEAFKSEEDIMMELSLKKRMDSEIERELLVQEREVIYREIGYRILAVEDDSPAARGSLRPTDDIIVAAEGTRLLVQDSTLIDCIKGSEDKELLLTVYSSAAKEERGVVLIPTKKWPGKGLLGATIRFEGYLKEEKKSDSDSDGEKEKEEGKDQIRRPLSRMNSYSNSSSNNSPVKWKPKESPNGSQKGSSKESPMGSGKGSWRGDPKGEVRGLKGEVKGLQKGDTEIGDDRKGLLTKTVSNIRGRKSSEWWSE